MTVRESVQEKIYELERDTGKTATCVYLGRGTFTRLKVEAEPWMNYNVGCDTHPQFCGLDIYVVTAEDHINVA